MNGIIPHKRVKYALPSDMFAAEECARQAVTIAFAYEHLVDEAVWLYHEEAEKWGMDPWVVIEGIDKSTAGEEYFLEHSRRMNKRVGPMFRVFAQKRDLARLGLLP